MFGRIFKKLTGKSDKVENTGAKFGAKLRQKAAEFNTFVSDRVQLVQDEFFTIRSKCGNLRETNYNLGLKHLEKGNLSDAIFRFRFIKKFWPDLFDAYYQLAYCLVLNKESQKAKLILEELLQKKPDFDSKAKDLLERINSGTTQPTSDA